MGAKSSAYANDMIKAVAAGTDPAWRSTVGQPHLYLSLHTAAPAVGGDQTSHEATYTGYARVEIDRNAGGLTVAADTMSNTAAITFPVATDPAEDETVTHVAIGLLDAGAGQILYVAELDAEQRIVCGLAARFAIGDLTFQET